MESSKRLTGAQASILAATIAACASVLTTLVTVAQATPGAAQAAVGEIVTDSITRTLPVGTVVASVLGPSAFAQAAGDDGTFRTDTSLWVPADARDVPGSKYAKIKASVVPDLRGVFLRGLNYSEDARVRGDGKGDPTGSVRKLGDYQEDTFGRHRHGSANQSYPLATGQGHIDQGLVLASWGDVRSKNAMNEERGGDETRPRNVAVLYYIKIN